MTDHLRHELRTPLNQILGYSELLQEEASGTLLVVDDVEMNRDMLLEALAWTAPLLALVVALKMTALRMVPAMRGEPVFEWTAGTPVTPVLILAYAALIPF